MKHAILKNKHLNLAGLMIASVFALAACGGGGGGGDHGSGGGGLATGTFTRTFNTGPALGIVVPFWDSTWGDVTAQFLFTAAEVGAGGKIVTLRFQRQTANAAATTCPNTTIRLGHTSIADLTGTYAADINGGTPVIVFNNATLTIPSGAAGSWFDVPLTTPFGYNGTDNLVVQVDRTTNCSGGVETAVRTTVANRLATSFAVDATAGTADNNTTTGTLFAYTAWMQFVFSGGDNKIDFGGVGSNFWPFSLQAPLRTQHLYLASEINGSGPITGIAFQMNAVSVAGTYTYTLRLGHSTLPALTTTYADNYLGSPTTVANAVSFTIPAGVPSGGWVWVSIPDGVFVYDGTNNLIVDVTTTAGTADNTLRETGIAGRRLSQSGLNPTTGTVDTNAYHMTLRFNGGPMAVITPNGTNGDAMPFWGVDGKRQYLYSATELGTKGTISKIACRAFLAGAAETGFNYTVALSHSTASALGTTFATNLTSPTTVFSGVLNTPAVLVGDWIEIPFSTPFAYNGKDNLVVEVSGTGGTAGGAACRMDDVSTARYAGRRLWSGVSAAATGAIVDSLVDMRFTLN